MFGLTFLTGSACGMELELDAWQGEHVLYESSPSLQVCQGTHAWVDKFVPFVAGELGLDVGRIQHYRWLDESDYTCSPEIIGCTSGIQASSLRPFLLHELVHTILYSLDFPYQPFFGEGIAFAFDPWYGENLGIRYLVHKKGAEKLADPRPYMTLGRQDLSYPLAGSFVMFLLARHDPAKFLTFLRELGTSRDMNIIEGAFRAAYGLELDDEAESFMTGVPCTEQSFGPGLYDCTSPEVPWTGDAWSFHDVMDCASETVAGGVGPERAWSSIRSVTLEVPATGFYQFSVKSDSNRIGVMLGPCSSCPWENSDVVVPSPGSKIAELEAGTHFVRIQAPSDETLNFEFSLRPAALP